MYTNLDNSVRGRETDMAEVTYDVIYCISQYWDPSLETQSGWHLRAPRESDMNLVSEAVHWGELHLTVSHIWSMLSQRYLDRGYLPEQDNIDQDIFQDCQMSWAMLETQIKKWITKRIMVWMYNGPTISYVWTLEFQKVVTTIGKMVDSLKGWDCLEEVCYWRRALCFVIQSHFVLILSFRKCNVPAAFSCYHADPPTIEYKPK